MLSFRDLTPFLSGRHLSQCQQASSSSLYSQADAGRSFYLACPDLEWGQTCQQKGDVQERPLEQTKRDPKRLSQANSTKIRENPATIHPDLEKRSKIHEKQVADRKSAKFHRKTGGTAENRVFSKNDVAATFQRRSSDVPATFQRRSSDVFGPKTGHFPKKSDFRCSLRFFGEIWRFFCPRPVFRGFWTFLRVWVDCCWIFSDFGGICLAQVFRIAFCLLKGSLLDVAFLLARLAPF